MFFSKLLWSVLALCFATTTYAQTSTEKYTSEECMDLLALAEEEPYDADLYTKCAFDELDTSIVYWGPIAEKNKWKTALYEIYKRHSDYPGSKTYLYQAGQLSHPEALITVGDELFQMNKVKEAMDYYAAAMRQELNETQQGKIAGSLAVLYSNPNSPYYDQQKALPLLQKAALQRHALSNNILGYLSLFGTGGMPQNATESFKYFWRAILLDCPAAQENLGFFLMGRENQIDYNTLLAETTARAYSCAGIAQTTDAGIQPYHLSFTPQQCADLNYYAERLVDTSLPFVGKNECGFNANMNTLTDLLSE